MFTIKVTFRPSTKAGSPGRIYYRISCECRVCHISSDIQLLASAWDSRRSCISIGCLGTYSEELRAKSRAVRLDMERLTHIASEFEKSGMPFTVEDVAEHYRIFKSEYVLKSFITKIIEHMKIRGQLRTSETYAAALRSFEQFICNSCPPGHPASVGPVMVDCFDSELMEAYQDWLHRRGVIANSVSFYMRILRAVYNRAVDRGSITDSRPFRKVYTGVDKTVKRAISLKVVRRIFNLDLHDSPCLAYARDIFMLSFYFRGMSFVDMAFLKKSDLRGGVLTYRRHKTGQLLRIAWTREMQTIVDKYSENSSAYLLPVIHERSDNEWKTYKNAASRINYALRKIAGKIGLEVPLTLYVARHSWASAARTKGVPLSVISEGLGHESESTTRIYLAELDTSLVDKANAQIIRCLL